MSVIRVAQVSVSAGGAMMVGGDDAVSNGPRQTTELTSSVQMLADIDPLSPILAPLSPVPSLTYTRIQPAGARRPVLLQFVSPCDLSKDTGVCLPTIDLASAHTQGDARCCLTLGQLPTLPRSKKTTKLKVNNNPANIHTATLQQREGAASATDVLLSIEGQDLKLPPPRTRTGARREHQKSRHQLNAVRVASELGLSLSRSHGDDIRSLEESLKTLLLCQSMGVTIQITRRRGDGGGLAQPVFHCSRCLKHWTDYGRLPPDCGEPEARVSGPSFAITCQSHEILQKFTKLTPVDKRCFLEAIRAQKLTPPRGENENRLTVSNECENVRMPATGYVEMSVTEMGDKAANTVQTLQNHPIHVANEFDVTIPTTREQEPDRQEDSTQLPNEASKSLQLTTHREGAKYSSTEDKHDSMSDREDNDSIDEGDTKGGPDSHPVQSRSEPCLFDTTDDTKIDHRTTVVQQAPDISLNHTNYQDKDMGFQNVDAVIAAKLVEENDELAVNQACYSNCASPRNDGPRSSETRLSDKFVPDCRKQRSEGSLLPVQNFTVNDENVLPEEYIIDISPNVMDDDRPRENRGKGSKQDTDAETNVSDAETNVSEAHQNMASNGNVFQDRKQLSDEETSAHHAIAKVTVTRNGLQQYLSFGTASFNNSAGANDIESNESFDSDGNEGEQSATPERRWEGRSARDNPAGHGNADSGHPPGQEKHDGRKTLSSKHNLGKGSAMQINRRESSISYMGVMQDGEENRNRGTSSSAEEGAPSQGSHEHISKGNKSAGRDQVAAQIRNTAVRNVTGKPDTIPGNLKRHMFATPNETLAQTNAFGMVQKSSGVGQAKDVGKQSQDHGYLTREDSGSNAHTSSAPRRESNVAATALPPLNTMPRQLPSTGVYDTEQKSKTRDRKRSLGLPRTDHALQEIFDRQQGQEEVSTKGMEMNEERKYTSRPVKRQPVPQEKEEDASKGQGLSRQRTERPQKMEKQKVEDDFGEQIATKQKNEKLSPESTDRFLPSLASTKGEPMSKETSDQQELREQETKSPPMRSLFSQFDNFELSLSPPPSGSLPPVSTDKSYRMTYSTLPKTFDWDTPRQPPLMNKRTLSPPPLGLAGNLTQPTTDELLDAKLMNQSMLVQRSSRDLYKSSARTRSRGTGIYPSASESSKESSPAESVWESLSEVWRRQAAELQKLERMITVNFLPLTSAFTFSLFEIPPQYLAHNRSLREEAMKIRTLKKPKKIVMKFASKEQRMAALRPPMIRRPIKPVK